MNTNDEDYLFGKPTEEVDVPVDRLQQNEADLEIKKIEREEKDKDRKERRYFTAFRLIVGCLIFLGAIYLVDTIVVVAFGKTSKTTNTIIEIVKALLFTLSGYLFAIKENGD